MTSSGGTVGNKISSNSSVDVDFNTVDPTGKWAGAQTTSGNSGGFVSFDDTYLYLGFVHGSLFAPQPDHHWVIYLGDGLPGSTPGVAVGPQAPQLPVAMSTALRLAVDGGSVARWDRSAGTWVADPSGLGPGGLFSGASLFGAMELRIRRDALPWLADTLVLSMALVHDTAGTETTLAGVPDDSFVDGFDPDWAAWLSVPLHHPAGPAAIQFRP